MMPPKPTPDRQARQLTLLRSEMKRALSETSQRRSILKQMVEGKSAESIAASEHLGVAAVKKHMHKIVHEYKDNFTTEVGFWVELLMTRYNALFEVLWPLAMNREAQAVKFVLEILEAQMLLTGASAADRQRQQHVDSFKQQVDGEITISVMDRYQQLLTSMQGGGERASTTTDGLEITVLPEGQSRTPASEEEEGQTALYRDDDGV